jgi:hypothetical protein
MKVLYWCLAGLAALLLVLGFTTFSSPDSQSVAVEVLDKWYLQEAIMGFVIGGLVGLPAALLAERFVQPRPHEAASTFNSRVVIYGLIVLAIAVLLAVVISTTLASYQTDWQLSGRERVVLVIGSGRFYGIPAAALLGSAIVFAAVIRARNWGGRYAVL